MEIQFNGTHTVVFSQLYQHTLFRLTQHFLIYIFTLRVSNRVDHQTFLQILKSKKKYYYLLDISNNTKYTLQYNCNTDCISCS
jgi:hypothetical protein